MWSLDIFDMQKKIIKQFYIYIHTQQNLEKLKNKKKWNTHTQQNQILF